MPEPAARDFCTCHVLSVDETDDGQRLAVRLRHEDHDDERAWSWCDLEVLLPAGREALERPVAGARAELVLRSTVIEARESELEGIYSCKLQPASMQPTFGYERPRDGFYSGLVQRDEADEDEFGPSVVFHMGSGLTCYARFRDEDVVDVDGLETGDWWEFRFEEPHEALAFRVLPDEVLDESDATSEEGAGRANGAAKRRDGWLARLLRSVSPARDG